MATAFAISAQNTRAVTTAVDLGTAAPPATLGGYTMTPFPTDGRPLFQDEINVPSPLGGDVTFSDPLTHFQIGNGWSTWSHGYTGDVYFTNGLQSTSLTLPANTGAFYFYAEPNLFGMFTVTVTDSSGVTIVTSVEGDSGANGFGFFADPGMSLVSVSITVDGSDFAIGEFGIASVSGGGEITLTAKGRRQGGNRLVVLSWTPADGGTINVLRDGVIIRTKEDNGHAQDPLPTGPREVHVYQVCETDTGTCSNEVKVKVPGSGQ